MATKRTASAKSKRQTGERVWAFLAVSSEVQSDTLDHQRRWAEEAAAANGWRVTRFVEGVASGKAGPRRLVRDLLTDLRSLDADARPKRVLMIRADRLGRGSIVESQIVLRDLQQLGVSVFTRDQGDVRLDSAMDELISAATLAVARHENEVRRDKMLSVYKRKRAAGQRIGNKLPYGLVEKNGKDAPDGKRATAVRTAFRMRLAGQGYHLIGQRLSEIAPPQRFKNGRELIVRWTPTRIARLLMNRAYIGPIIDAATFARAQVVADTLGSPERDRDERRTFPWPLSGSLRCYCGRSMSGLACGDADRRIRYYACRASWNHDVTNRLVRADRLEEQFLALLVRLKSAPNLIDRYRRKASPESPRTQERSLSEARKQLVEVDRKRDAAWELHVSGKVRPEDVQERLDKLAEQRDEIRARIAMIEERVAIARSVAVRDRDADAMIDKAADLFAKVKEPHQRQIARAVSVLVGGLCVEEDGNLAVRSVVDANAQRKAHTRPATR
jgi:DNA invertase Pin-like site-specific DNA recombinase